MRADRRGASSTTARSSRSAALRAARSITRPRAARRLAGRSHGERPVRYGGAWTAAASKARSASCDLARDVPPAGRAPRRQPGFHDRRQAELSGTIRHGARALRRCTRRRCRGARSSFARCSASPGPRTRTARGSITAMRGRPATGDRCRIEGGIEAAYKAELEAAPDRTELAREITERLNRCARRSAPRSGSRSRKSSIRATRAAAVRVCVDRGASARPGTRRVRLPP